MKVIREHRDPLVLRVRALAWAVAILLVAVAGGFWSVQVVSGDRYRDLAENNRLRRLPLEAPRGLIYDRHGVPLVENVPGYGLRLDRSRTESLDRTLDFVARVLEAPRQELDARLAEARDVPEFQPVLLARRLNLSQVARIGVANLEYPELEIDVEHLRLYRHGFQTSHVLGYLGRVSEDELERHPDLYDRDDLVGKRGVEEVYDRWLRGEDGRVVVVVDSRGRVIEEYGREEPRAGNDLHLTLDLALQQAAERQLRDRVGAVVALDPDTGEVLAMASSPAFDSNAFVRGLTEGEWQELVQARHNPLQNRALQNTHSPGSVFKIVVGSAGLAEGVVTTRERVYCPGWTTIYGRRFHCWKAGGHGWVNMEEALAGSCNVYFWELGKELGVDRIADYARRFGLGELTGIRLGGEAAGLVPDPAWSVRTRGHPWFPGETISLAVGQGPLLVTPLQLARATAAVANGGRLVRPRLVERTAEEPAMEHLNVPSSALEIIRRGLRAVVNDPKGTAYWSGRLPDVEIAGKTGTAQVVGERVRASERDDVPFEKRTHAWFASFAPADDPELVVVVFIEHGGAGSAAAAPVAKALYQAWFSRREGASEDDALAG